MGFVTERNMCCLLTGEPSYQSALQKEADAWSVLRVPTPQDHPLRSSYQNEVVTGDPANDIVRWIAARYGPFDQCCTLGCGTGRMERRFLGISAISHLYAYDISAAALESLASAAPGQVHPEVADLNFVQLPENSFDAVIVWESLHHVINLEHLLWQIALSLKPRGVVLIREFVGETRWQWSNPKRHAVNRLVRQIQNAIPHAPVHRLQRWVRSMSPFESIRSGEIIELLQCQFEGSIAYERQFETLCHDALNVIDYRQTGTELDDALRILIEADRQLPIPLPYQPSTLFAICGKPQHVRQIHAQPWSAFEILMRLDTARFQPPAQRLRTYIKRRLQFMPGGGHIWQAWAYLAHRLSP